MSLLTQRPGSAGTALMVFVRFAAVAVRARCRRLLAAMRETREREAAVIIARSPHLFGGGGDVSSLDRLQAQELDEPDDTERCARHNLAVAMQGIL